MIEQAFTAKSGGDSEWLPLWMHLEDTAGVMNYLLDDYISDSFLKSSGLEKDELRKTAVFIAYTHDIGKATIGFQVKIGQAEKSTVGRLEHYGLIIPDTMDRDVFTKTPHALASEVILNYFDVPKTISVIAGSHHGMTTECTEVDDQDLKRDKSNIKNNEGYFGDDYENNRAVLEKVWKKIINTALKKSNLKSVDELPDVSEHAQMILCGLLIMADWIASNTEYFPLIGIDKIVDENIYPERVIMAWKKIKFPKSNEITKSDYNEERFENEFGFKPNNTQKETIEILKSVNSPGIYILEAPMGLGKTETALSGVEILSEKFGNKGLFFGLPTQSTANGIFPRIKNWGAKQSNENYHTIELKHGNAALNDEFTNIHGEKFDDTFERIQSGITDKEEDNGLLVHSWFCGNKKACLADFVVGTVDQMLMMSLKRKHVMLLHLGLSEKVVIIDEVHAYDAYMNEYLERSLEWLGKYNTPVILLSATLPSERRLAFIKAYCGKTKKKLKKEEFEDNIKNNLSYPLFTWTDGEKVHQRELSFNGTTKQVSIQKCHDDDIKNIVQDTIDAGGCIGIIVNTVRKAQKIYEEIKSEVTKNIFMISAQFTSSDRAKKENELIKRVGKKSTEDIRKGFVCIGTQVLEQSLDIDFDVLITDICPVDLLLQRIGRLQRHIRKNRPIKNPVCCVTLDEFEKEKSSTKKMYSEWILQKTVENFPDNVTLPSDISILVQKVYNSFDESEEYREFKNNKKKSRNKADAFLLNKPDDEIDDTIHGLLSRDVKISDDTRATAAVRDGTESIEVILMQMKNNEIHFIDSENAAVPCELSPDECKKIAKQTIRLPLVFSRNIDETIGDIENQSRGYIENWQNSYLLQGKLVLFLDENLEGHINNFKVSYNFETGFKYENMKASD